MPVSFIVITYLPRSYITDPCTCMKQTLSLPRVIDVEANISKKKKKKPALH